MLFNATILPLIIAGILNGSFVIPAKYVKNFTHEKIWLYHSVIGLVIIPWLLFAFLSPHLLHNYLLLPVAVLAFIIGSGAIFGVGQICFAYAIESIGIALSFTINLGIGVVIGSLFVVFFNNTFFTLRAYFTLVAVLLILGSLVIHYFAGNKISPSTNLDKNPHYQRGWMLACLAGLASGLQNITFVIVAFHAKTLFPAANSFWVWPPFLLAASFVMLAGFSYKVKKHSASDVSLNWQLTVRNIALIALMGLFFAGSLAIYSSAMSQLSHQQQIIGWPTFMVSIILASQVWGWFYESQHTHSTRKLYRLMSVLLLISAVIILAIEP